MSAPNFTYTVSSTTNRISSVGIGAGNYPVGYDNRGFITGFVGKVMSYDPFGQMTRFTDPASGLESHYFYNASDQRIATIEHIGSGPETATFLGRDLSGKILREFEREIGGSGSYKDYVWTGLCSALWTMATVPSTTCIPTTSEARG